MSTFNAASVDAEIARVKKRIAELEPQPPKPCTIFDPDWIPMLRDARKARGISQAQVSRRMDTTQSAVSDIEHGVSIPRIDTLARYAAAVGYRMVVTFEPLDDLTEEGTAA